MGTERIHKGKSIISLPSSYVVIDIETTGLSPEYNEIIEVGAHKIKEGQIIDTFSSLIKPSMKPYGSYIDEFIENLTGITNEMLSSAPEILEIFPQYMDFIGDNIIVGHNVNFDINFLYDYSEKYLNKPFINDFVDTMRLFRKLHPELKHHRVRDLAKLYSLDYSNAHRALTDCNITQAGYSIFLNEIATNYSSTDDFIRAFDYVKSGKACKAADIIADDVEINEDNPLYGKVFVFTGVLDRMVRKEAMQIVVNHGGLNGDNVTKKTNYLVLGNNDYCTQIKDGKSNKLKKAEQYKLEGFDIEIIPENVFYDMIEE